MGRTHHDEEFRHERHQRHHPRQGRRHLWLLRLCALHLRGLPVLQLRAGSPGRLRLRLTRMKARAGDPTRAARRASLERYGTVDAGFRDPSGNGWTMIHAARG
jgi:hypothetical protein